jgi:hypothetical protein
LLIYAIDKADKSMEPTRKVTTDFFKNSLGFIDDEIIFIDVNEFGKDEKYEYVTKFNAKTEENLEKFATRIF